MSDIFGGNAFQVCLFLVADMIAGRPVLPAAGTVNSWLAALGIVLSIIYGTSVIVRPAARYLRLGADSLIALLFFAAGVAGLLLLGR
jgi:cation:H+ antiporter